MHRNDSGGYDDDDDEQLDEELDEQQQLSGAGQKSSSFGGKRKVLILVGIAVLIAAAIVAANTDIRYQAVDSAAAVPQESQQPPPPPVSLSSPSSSDGKSNGTPPDQRRAMATARDGRSLVNNVLRHGTIGNGKRDKISIPAHKVGKKNEKEKKKDNVFALDRHKVHERWDVHQDKDDDDDDDETEEDLICLCVGVAAEIDAARLKESATKIKVDQKLTKPKKGSNGSRGGSSSDDDGDRSRRRMKRDDVERVVVCGRFAKAKGFKKPNAVGTCSCEEDPELIKGDEFGDILCDPNREDCSIFDEDDDYHDDADGSSDHPDNSGVSDSDTDKDDRHKLLRHLRQRKLHAGGSWHHHLSSVNREYLKPLVMIGAYDTIYRPASDTDPNNAWRTVDTGPHEVTVCVADAGYAEGHPYLPTYVSGMVNGTDFVNNETGAITRKWNVAQELLRDSKGEIIYWCERNTTAPNTSPYPCKFDENGTEVPNLDAPKTNYANHGTFMAGIIAAIHNCPSLTSCNPTLPGTPVGGVAPGVKLHITRAIDDEGGGLVSDVIKAVEQCRDVGADIINLSLGWPSYHSVAAETFKSLYEDDGILIFAAAGNVDYPAPLGGDLYPASYPEVVAVTAINNNYLFGIGTTPLWNRNRQTELVTRGYLIPGLFAKDWKRENDGTYVSPSTTRTYAYTSGSGTSQATAYASGAAALLMSNHPTCTNKQIRNCMAKMAKVCKSGMNAGDYPICGYCTGLDTNGNKACDQGSQLCSAGSNLTSCRDPTYVPPTGSCPSTGETCCDDTIQSNQVEGGFGHGVIDVLLTHTVLTDEGCDCGGPRLETTSSDICDVPLSPVPPEPSLDPGKAVFNVSLGSPACLSEGISSCDSGALLDGRANLGPEPHQPNTIDGCEDGGSGEYHGDESLDRLKVYTVDGGKFAPGVLVEINATVWAWGTGSYDNADFYYANSTNSPVWEWIGTVDPPAGGVQVLTVQYTLPAGDDLQAVRVNFRYNSNVGPCAAGNYNDRDDLVFAVPSPSDSPSSMPSPEPSESPSEPPSYTPSSSPSPACEMTATYNASIAAPVCSSQSSCCDSGALLDGRANLGPETNQPNTIDGCADGGGGTYHGDESLDGLKVYTVDGGKFAPGVLVEIEATVWAWSTGSKDNADFYYANSTNSPVWEFIGTVAPPDGGVQVLTVQHNLTAGDDLQAVRVNFRYISNEGPCADGNYNDRDDLVFAVGAGTTSEQTALTQSPSVIPSSSPSLSQSSSPSVSPSQQPSAGPTDESQSPSAMPSAGPTDESQSPSAMPSAGPTDESQSPSAMPSAGPTDESQSPSAMPSAGPTDESQSPSAMPSAGPTDESQSPSAMPSAGPTDESQSPSAMPSAGPTDKSQSPSISPSQQPSAGPTDSSQEPSAGPTDKSQAPSQKPSAGPTDMSQAPRQQPSADPTDMSQAPSLSPSTSPTDKSKTPSQQPSAGPTDKSQAPSQQPSAGPTDMSQAPSLSPSTSPTDKSQAPSQQPSAGPTDESQEPSQQPSAGPTDKSQAPSQEPSAGPTDESQAPSQKPSAGPTDMSQAPSLSPSTSPTDKSQAPSQQPSAGPTDESQGPSQQPSAGPTDMSQAPSLSPSTSPTDKSQAPSQQPSADPTDESQEPSQQPSAGPTDKSQAPSQKPSAGPTDMSQAPSQQPSADPTDMSQAPSQQPSSGPTDTSQAPSVSSSQQPSSSPSLPSDGPSQSPTVTRSDVPTSMPSSAPSESPSATPTLQASAPPSSSSEPTWVILDEEDFSSGWGIWNDGGSDARRSANDAPYCKDGKGFCIRIRDNSSTSTMRTDLLDVRAYTKLKVAFWFMARKMEDGEDFFLEYSEDDGESWTKVGDWVIRSGTDFTNNNGYYLTDLEIPVINANNIRIQFRCDASGNGDHIFIDDVKIEGQ